MYILCLFQNLSAAIFAPGWTHECHPKDGAVCYPGREYKFWKLIRPYLFTRGPVLDEDNPKFQTYFCPGFGLNLDSTVSWWLNLTCQGFQPSLLAHPHTGKSWFFLWGCCCCWGRCCCCWGRCCWCCWGCFCCFCCCCLGNE